MRRRLAAFCLALLGMTAVAPFDAAADAAPVRTGKVVAAEVRHSAPATRGAGARALASASATVFTSDVVAAGQAFDHLGVRWEHGRGAGPHDHDAEAALSVEIRVSADGSAWSEWRRAPADEDLADEENGVDYATPLQFPAARFAQYRLTGDAADVDAARAITLTFLDATDLNLEPAERLLLDLASAWQRLTSPLVASAAPGVRVYTRAEWGADESLMRWSPEYEPWRKAVVHHTVTTNSYTDARAQIRSIYYFHAVTRGWGDIGYNFLVDKFGNVWAGRAGGDDAIGGHAYGWNDGTFGVSALGDFRSGGVESALVQGIAGVIAMKFAARGISPTGADAFTHYERDASGIYHPVTSSPPNILGHYQAVSRIGASGGETACPGGNLINELDSIRTLARSLVGAGYAYYAPLTVNLPASATAGQALSVPVTVKNLGSRTISAATTKLSYWIVDLATGNTVAHGPLTALPSDVPPGGTVNLSAAFVAPTIGGSYVARWDLQQPGVAWFASMYGTPTTDRRIVVRDVGVQWVSASTPRSISPGVPVTTNVTLKNTGVTTWQRGVVNLSYHWYNDETRRVVQFDGERTMLPKDVAPGEQITVAARVLAPTGTGRMRLLYDLVHEGRYWFSDLGLPTLRKTVTVGFVFRATYSTPPAASTLSGVATTVPVTLTNTGTSLWPATGLPRVALGTHLYTSAGALVLWDGPRTPLPGDVRPGGSVTVNATLPSPPSGGSYRVALDLVLEGTAWFSTRGVSVRTVPLSVHDAAYGARYEVSTAGTSGDAAASGAQLRVPVSVTNTSNFAWHAPDVALAYHLYDASGAVVRWDGARTQLAAPLAPGATATLSALVDVPPAAGSYLVKWDMVHEGVAWFSTKGVPPGQQIVRVAGPYGAAYTVAAGTAAAAGSTALVAVELVNTGSLAWQPGEVALAYHLYAARQLVVWDGVRTALPAPVPPGGRVAVLARVALPARTGELEVRFDLVREGVAWFSSLGVLPASTVVVAR